MTEQITLRELLKDPGFKAFFMKVPTITVKTTTPPWRLFVQRDEAGKWARADLPSYPKAYAAVRARLSECHDMAIHSKPQAWRPPIVVIGGKKSWLPCPDDHYWCVYCRRPTIFGYFSKHPAMPHLFVADYELRCSVCAARLAGMKKFKPRASWEQYRAATSS